MGLLASAGDVWACELEKRVAAGPAGPPWPATRDCAGNWPRPGRAVRRTGQPGARSCCAVIPSLDGAAKRRRNGDGRARFRGGGEHWCRCAGTTAPQAGGRATADPVTKGRPALWVRLDGRPAYRPEQVRSVTLVYDAGRLWADVTAEVPVAQYPPGQGPDPARVAGVDIGIIHPYAVAGPAGQGLLVSGRAIRAEHRMHLADRKARAPGGRPPRPQAGAEGVAAVAALPAPPAAGRGAAPAAGPPGPARGRQSRDRLGR